MKREGTRHEIFTPRTKLGQSEKVSGIFVLRRELDVDDPQLDLRPRRGFCGEAHGRPNEETVSGTVSWLKFELVKAAQYRAYEE